MYFSYSVRIIALVVILLLGSGLARAAESIRIHIQGVDGKEKENVLLSAAPPDFLVRDGKINPRWLKRFLRQLPRRAQKALQPYGYYKATVKVETREQSDSKLDIYLTVEPGPPVIISRLAVSIEGDGRELKPLEKIVQRFPLKEGGVLQQDVYEATKGALKARAIDLGFLEARFSTASILIDSERTGAEVELVLDTGPRFLFGSTTFSGASQYPRRYLERHLTYRKGRPFSYEKLGQSQSNLLGSERFRQALVRMEDSGIEPLHKNISIELVPTARRKLRPGIGFGTDTGARFSLNYRDLNMRGRGHEFNADLLMAEIRQVFSVGYTVPSYRNLDSATHFTAGFTREDLDTYQSRSIASEIEKTRGYGRGRLGAVYLRLSQERYSIGNDSGRSEMLVLGVRYSQRRIKAPARPRKGYLYRLELRGAHRSVLSDVGLMQVLAEGVALRPLPWQMTAILGLHSAVTLQNDSFEDIPPSLRFFAGGDKSIRGYAYQSLGPKDEAGDVIGGKHLFTGSIEIEKALGANWSAALFYDAGNAFDSPEEFRWAQGAGVGVRRYTPVGPVKLDLARQVGVDDPSFRIHVSVGVGW